MADEILGVDLLLTLPGVEADAAAALAIRLLDRAMAAGDTCLDLGEWAGRSCGAQSAPPLAAWQDSLRRCGLVGDALADLPLVLDGDLLSSRRYWHYERDLAAQCSRRAADRSRLATMDRDPGVAADCAQLFPANPEALVDGVDWQRVAACVGLAHGLALITGGPGTGKTTVAGRLIAIAARHRERQGQELSVVIAAPTGKAAQRLRESLIGTGQPLLASGFLGAAQLGALTAQVATLHRLLYDRRLPAVDLLVIDEVSMADAATLARVLERVPDEAQVLLLGDPEQLASVDAGHVLGELARFATPGIAAELHAWYVDCGGAGEAVPLLAADAHPLAAAQVALRRNWRSAASPAVSALAAAIQASPQEVAAVLADPALQPQAGRLATVDGDVQPVWIERRDCPEPARLARELIALWRDWAVTVISAVDPGAALTEHARRRLLCARRSGPQGAEAINAALEEALEQAGTIHRREDGHYHGRPLLVTRNDYDLQLFNGDIGVVWLAGNRAEAHFPTSSGGLRQVPLNRLAEVEAVFAMSIHKSQGSQFDHVDVVTASDDSGPVGELLTRELVYTAITRAAYSVRIWAAEDLLLRSLARRKVRRTGLGRFLSAERG